MIDAFLRFANGIITNESSNHGGGGGRHPGHQAPQQTKEQDEDQDELHLGGDSLRLSRGSVSMFRFDCNA